MLAMPPMPDADDDADALGTGRRTGSAASSTAICAAAMAYWVKRSIFLRSFRSMKRSGIEVGHLAGDLHRKRRGVEARDRPDARAAGDELLPIRLDTDTERSDQPEPGHYHAPARAVGAAQVRNASARRRGSQGNGSLPAPENHSPT